MTPRNPREDVRVPSFDPMASGMIHVSRQTLNAAADTSDLAGPARLERRERRKAAMRLRARRGRR